MSKTGFILLMSLGLASSAYAQSTSGGVTMSTDPAKAAAVERHAQELKTRPSMETQAKPAAKHSTTPKAKTQTKKKPSAAKPTTAKKS